MRGADGCRGEVRAPRAGQGEDHQQQTHGGDRFGSQWGPEARCLVKMWMRAGLGERRVGEDGPADASERLEWRIASSILPLDTAETGINEGDDRVEVTTRDRSEHQDDSEQARRRCRPAFSKSCSPMLPGDRFCTAMPEPITMAARKALPKNSASRRRHKTAGVPHSRLPRLPRFA